MESTLSFTSSEPEIRLTMMGLHECGKTTLLDQILRQWKDSLPQIHWPVHWRKGSNHSVARNPADRALCPHHIAQERDDTVLGTTAREISGTRGVVAVLQRLLRTRVCGQTSPGDMGSRGVFVDTGQAYWRKGYGLCSSACSVVGYDAGQNER